MTRKRQLIAGTAAVALVAGGGAAIAATQFSSSHPGGPAPSTTAAQVADDGKIGVEGAGGFGNAKGEDLRGRGFGGSSRGFFNSSLGAAATYLGVSTSRLDTILQTGATLAQVAKDQGKPVAGLVRVMITEQKKLLRAAVADGQLSQEDEQSIESRLVERTKDRINGRRSFRGPPGSGGGQTAPLGPNT